MIRNARVDDVKAIYKLLNYYAEKDLLLPRSLSSLYDQLRDFKVVVEKEPKSGGLENNSEVVIGIGALHVCWEDLAEIRSVAVVDSFQGKGVGRRIVEACLAESEEMGIKRIFTLTYQPNFFKKMGFKPIDKGELPHKVWSDCLHCPKFPDCNEEALIWEKHN